MAYTISAAAAQAMGVALASDIGAGAILRIYSGSRPATPETAIGAQVLLATVTITGSFTSTGGVLTAADPGAVAIAASGTAAWFRLLAASGPTAKIDGTVGTSGADLIVGTTTFTSGANFDLGVPTINIPVA